MIEKKEEIMQAAMQFFSEKGYFSTSVQEIANNCSIAKGSIYKYFDSKEHLLIEIIEYIHQKRLQKAMNINLDASLSAKEKFIQKTDIELKDLLDNKGFITMLSNSLPDHENGEILAHVRRTRAAMMNWHKENLLLAFGNNIRPYIWDLAIMFEGTLKEYLFLMAHDHKPIETHHTARFIIDRFDTLIRYTEDPEPVLTAQMMKEYEEFDISLQPKPLKEQLSDLLQQMKTQVHAPAACELDPQELFATITLLQEEMTTEQPRPFLIKALLAYLEKEDQLTGHVQRMKTVLQSWHNLEE